MKKLVLLALLLSAVYPIHAQTPVRLLCKGTLETKKDGVPEVKATTVDVTLDTTMKNIELEGFWGCLADMGTVDIKSGSFQCHGRQPVRVEEGEITYFAKIDGAKYYAQTNAILNRYSATLSINSHSFSKPDAGASWAIIMINGKLQCSNQEKKF
jgi:hypothetical protein